MQCNFYKSLNYQQQNFVVPVQCSFALSASVNSLWIVTLILPEQFLINLGLILYIRRRWRMIKIVKYISSAICPPCVLSLNPVIDNEERKIWYPSQSSHKSGWPPTESPCWFILPVVEAMLTLSVMSRKMNSVSRFIPPFSCWVYKRIQVKKC